MCLTYAQATCVLSECILFHACPGGEFYGLKRKKEESLSEGCTEPARCTVSCKLSVVTRSPCPLLGPSAWPYRCMQLCSSLVCPLFILFCPFLPASVRTNEDTHQMLMMTRINPY
jgi:hypothetical protein